MASAKKGKKFIPLTKDERLAFIAQLDQAEAKKYENKRSSPKRDFENIYLRVNAFKKAMTNPPTERIAKLLSGADFNKDFNKITTYMAKKVFNRYEKFFLTYGFDIEDIVCISRVFGINFYTSNAKSETQRGENYLLMNYLGQRFHGLINWSIKKFGNSFPIHPVGLGDNIDEGWDDVVSNLSLQVWNEARLAENDQFGGTIISEGPSMEKQQSTVEDLRGKLDANWEKHRETLAHYATTAYAPQDVRKKARSFCVKYGIDYESWAKSKIEAGKMNDYDVDLGK